MDSEDGVEFGIDHCQLLLQVPAADRQSFQHHRGAGQRLDRFPGGRVFSSAGINAGRLIPRYRTRMLSGAVTRSALIWVITETRARMAVARCARNTRTDSTAPSRDFGVATARPASTDSAA
ncbi:hypothetical protein [Arthrobacter sp. ISL-30]|uniref:hypothetical protein n=1 Tax=Arthrobacter sp. ISL-30 TaxID=2819109 RepID=UPI0020360DF1|nr:hypothetical protein [Arthrobacter sp. ISL-30]